MTPAQCRAARALIAMSQADLGQAAIFPAAVLMDFEEAHLDAIAYRKAGILAWTQSSKLRTT